LRILQINNYGYVRGGSDRYFIDLGMVLSGAGHDVSYLVSRNAKNIVDSRFAVDGFNVESPSLLDIPSYIYSRNAVKQLRKLISSERPDIAHLHIYYGQITSSILKVLKDSGIPVVQTVHEYKLLCPISSMVRNGEFCDLCASGGYWRAAVYRCNRGQLLRSAITSVESYTSKWLGSHDKVDHFIAVSDFVRNKLVVNGIEENRVTTIHNFVRDDLFRLNESKGGYFLYIGRIEKAKGIGSLITAMASLPDMELLIAGVGEARVELETQVNEMGLSNVRFLGFKTSDELRGLIAGSICVVNPSESFETFGLVLVESFAQSRPVIASHIGGMSEVVTHDVDGFMVEPGNVVQLTSAMKQMAADPGKAIDMGRHGYLKAKQEFSSGSHYEKLMSLYTKVISNPA